MLIFLISYNVKEELISSKPITINVKELPKPKPKGFLGAVGVLDISAKVNKKELNANDAITYSVKITGTGNIELIDAMKIDFPEDFEVYDPKINDRIFEGGNKRSTKTYEYLLIPRYKGNYEIPTYNFVFFNTKTKKYQTIKTAKFNISVLKSSNEEKGYIPINQQNITTSNKDINYIKTSTILTNQDKNSKLKFILLLFSLPLLLILFFLKSLLF